MRLVLVLVASFFAPVLLAQPADDRRAVVALIEDDNDAFIQQLNNDGSRDMTEVRQEFRDVYCGVASIRVTPFQRFSSRIKDWNYPIAEKPALGQYRFLRFAWKRLAKPGEQVGIMIQLNSKGNWNQRYYAGTRSNQTAAWGPMIQVDSSVPREWTVVTRDLYKDFGPMTLHGIALTPMENGVAGLFDHVYLGRTIEDLDRASAEAFGKTPLKEPLTLLQLGELWEDLAKAEIKVTGLALRMLVAGKKESVPYLAKMLRVKPPAGDAKQVERWIDELDHEVFQTREAAFRELEKLADAAIRPLQTARPKAHSVEQRNRIDDLLKIRGIAEGQLTNEQLRQIRAVRVLEWAGTREALTAVDEFIKDGPDATILADVQGVRQRLQKIANP